MADERKLLKKKDVKISKNQEAKQLRKEKEKTNEATEDAVKKFLKKYPYSEDPKKRKKNYEALIRLVFHNDLTIMKGTAAGLLYLGKMAFK